jgi:hypothetical protein
VSGAGGRWRLLSRVCEAVNGIPLVGRSERVLPPVAGRLRRRAQAVVRAIRVGRVRASNCSPGRNNERAVSWRPLLAVGSSTGFERMLARAPGRFALTQAAFVLPACCVVCLCGWGIYLAACCMRG